MGPCACAVGPCASPGGPAPGRGVDGGPPLWPHHRPRLGITNTATTLKQNHCSPQTPTHRPLQFPVHAQDRIMDEEHKSKRKKRKKRKKKSSPPHPPIPFPKNPQSHAYTNIILLLHPTPPASNVETKLVLWSRKINSSPGDYHTGNQTNS